MIIHIDWDGPFSAVAISEKTGGSDYGLYQIYGPHPIYGTIQLLYIGKAGEQTFGVRISQHEWVRWTRDPSKVEVYVGRICDSATPTNDVWTKQIDMAERLLIFAHYPPYNTQKQLSALEPDLREVHVLNWRSHRDLLPEVSGARWTSKFDDYPGYHAYSNTELRNPIQGNEVD